MIQRKLIINVGQIPLPSLQIPWYLLDYYRAYEEPGSTVSIVSDYGLDDRGSIPERRKDFSCILCARKGFGTHPASYPMSTGGPFPGVNRGHGVTLTTHPI
jgi:hypothetical protein